MFARSRDYLLDQLADEMKIGTGSALAIPTDLTVPD